MGPGAVSGFVLKPGGASVAWVMDWRRGHLAPRERVLRDLGWTVQPGGAGELCVADQGHGPAASWAVFAGGRPGRSYIVTNRVRTSDDRVLARAIVVRVAPRAGARRRPEGGPRAEGNPE